MTREETIKEIEVLKEDYWDDDGYGHETKQYDDTMLALDIAINALEQESILDKAIAEIDRIGCVCHASDNYDELIRKNTVLKILNKYKAEFEPQESEDKE